MAAPILPLALFLACLLAQRAAELWISRANARRLAARGAVEFGRPHFLLFVLLHAAFPVSLVWEVLRADARAPAGWPVFACVWLGAQALRVWAVTSLGPYWNVRVWVLPGAAPVVSGPYRWLRHPNYVAVITEFVAGPMMFGAWRTALAFSALNAIALAVRIPVEQRALAWAAAQDARDANTAGAVATRADADTATAAPAATPGR